jgi:hypothetical protein
MADPERPEEALPDPFLFDPLNPETLARWKKGGKEFVVVTPRKDSPAEGGPGTQAEPTETMEAPGDPASDGEGMPE